MSLAQLDRYDADSVPRRGDRAVVVGGSIAGLAASRVLADAFDEVVVLERGPIPDEPVPRDGAPQTAHPHVLLEAGRASLEDLLPGFCEDVLAGGGLVVDFGTDIEEYNRGGFLADARERFPTYCASRPLFEHVVREHVGRLASVDLRGEHHVTGYLTDADGTTVTGVEHRAGDGTQRSIPADLVVDATGRTSHTPRWLETNGYDAPPVEEVTIDVSYRSVRIERPPDDRRMRMVAPSAPRTRGAALIPIEDGQWEVIVQGVHDDDPPADREGLVDYTRALPVSTIGDLLAERPWVSETVKQYPYPASRRHRYGDLDRLPEGLVVVGDAVASFNPVYGQGMSVAALDAVALHHALASGDLADLPERLFERIEPIVDNVWNVVVGGDFAFEATTGPEPTGTALTNWYMDRLVHRAHADPVVSEAFARVTRLEEPPTALVRPRVAWRVLWPSVESSPLGSLADRGAAALGSVIR